MPDLESLFDLPVKAVWDDQQRMAIERCCDVNVRVVPVTGKAGTGKTSIIKEVYDRLTALGYNVVCSAPTGKAAKRIKEATGIDAVTNHRMLGYGMPFDKEIVDEVSGEKKMERLSTGPKYTRKDPMPWDVILCDEYAMVNNEIHRNIIDAMKYGSRIRMFGDVNQLKPIEEDRRLQSEPSPFEQVLKKFNGIELITLHRQQEGSGVAENAARILAGRPLVKRDDFILRMTDDPVNSLRQFVQQQLTEGIDFSSTDHQIITCQNKSWVGTSKLNPVLQTLFWNRDRLSIELPRWRWSDKQLVRVQPGSKVVYTANSYDLNNGHAVFNGEIGIVLDIHDDGSLDVDFIDRVVTIPARVVTETPTGRREYDPRCNVDLAYALTTHKMQGSECKHAVYIMNKSTLYGQSRRNFYTGVTRARKHCTVITDSVSLNKSLKFAG